MEKLWCDLRKYYEEFVMMKQLDKDFVPPQNLVIAMQIYMF